jgi:hypothetical protein
MQAAMLRLDNRMLKVAGRSTHLTTCEQPIAKGDLQYI